PAQLSATWRLPLAQRELDLDELADLPAAQRRLADDDEVGPRLDLGREPDAQRPMAAVLALESEPAGGERLLLLALHRQDLSRELARLGRRDDDGDEPRVATGDRDDLEDLDRRSAGGDGGRTGARRRSRVVDRDVERRRPLVAGVVRERHRQRDLANVARERV